MALLKPKRRKSLSKAMRDFVKTRQKGLCACGCGAQLQDGFHLDHDPPLELRVWDDAIGDTVPPANSLQHLFGLTPDCHRRKTNHPLGDHTVLNSDRHAIDKGKRIRGEVGQNKPKRQWGSRSIPKRHDPWGKGRKL